MMRKLPFILVPAVTGVLLWAGITTNESADSATYTPRSQSSNGQYTYGFAGAAEYYHRVRANKQTGVVDLEDVQRAEQQVRSRSLRKKSALGLQFVERGPDDVGGRSRAIMVDRTVEDGSKIFVGSVSGGLFVSENGGGRWEPHIQFTNTAQTSSMIASIEQAPNGDIYVGTGSNFDQFASTASIPWPGKGVFRSRDGGDTFEPIASTTPAETNSKNDPWHAVNRIKFDPNTGRIYAATSRGLRMSDDDGVTWINPVELAPGIPATGIGMDVDVASDGTVLAAVGGAIFRSETGDVGSWTNVTEFGLSAGVRSCLEWAPSNEDYAYVIVAQSGTAALQGVYQTKDKGLTWARILEPIPDYFNPLSRVTPTQTSSQGVFDLAIGVDPNDEERIFIGGIELWRWDGNLTRAAAEFGNGFSPLYVHADKHFFYWDPTDESGNTLFICSDGGVGRSDDNGETFSVQNKGFNVTQFYGIAYDPNFGYVMGGSQDNGTLLMVGTNALNPLTAVQVFGNDGFDCEISQLVELAFVTSQRSAVFRGSTQPPFADISQPYNFADNQPFTTVIRLWESANDLTSQDSILFKVEPIETGLAVGNGVSKTFTGVVAPIQASGKIVPGSIRVSAGFSVLDNTVNDTILAGDGNGTIKYNENGSVNIEVIFDEAPITNATVFVLFSTEFEANAVIELESATGSLPVYHRLETALNPGDEVLIQDPYQSILALSIVGEDNANARLGLYRGALVTAEEPVWFEVDGIGGTVSCTEFTPDGNHVYVGSSNGSVYRVSGLSNLYEAADVANLTVTQIFASGQSVTGISLDGNDSGRMVVTLGNYGNSSYVWLLNNALTATSPGGAGAINVQGSGETGLPAMPVYDAEIDINNPAIVVLGTERGVWATDNIEAGAGSVEWTNENDALTSVPVYDVRQQRRDFSQARNAGVYYFGTHGRGIWESTSLVGIGNVTPGSDSKEDLISDLTVYPNPMRDQGYLKFSADESAVANVTIYDLGGRAVKNMGSVKVQSGENNVRIYNGDLSKGTYIVTLESSNFAKVAKFVVLH